MLLRVLTGQVQSGFVLLVICLCVLMACRRDAAVPPSDGNEDGSDPTPSAIQLPVGVEAVVGTAASRVV